MAGQDVEFLLKNEDGKYISAVGIVPGYKSDPFRTPHGWVQQDNVAGEVNIKPSKSVQEFVEWTHGVKEDLTNIIKPLGLTLANTASAMYDDDQLQSKEAMEAGCEPDMCVYTMEENTKPDLTGAGLRSAGGHIHLSWSGPVDSERAAVVKNADLFISLPGLLLDNDIRRRRLYGAAGAYRNKEYGVEVRSPSNFWTRTKRMTAWAYWNAIASVVNMDEADAYPNVQTIINRNDLRSALSVIEELKIPMPGGVDYASAAV